MRFFIVHINAMCFRIVCIAFLLVQSVVLYGEEGDFTGLSLEQLLDIDVSVASVGEESIPQTPAIVSRYNLDDIKKMGISRLEDLLSLVPGIVVKQNVGGYPVVLIRGITQFTNQKVLFLLDDVPYWDSQNGNFPIRGIPIEAIDHVEVIRGPGAIYYGTNATTGVIKVSTKKGSENIVTTSAGSNGLRHNSGYIQHGFYDDVQLHFSYEFRREDGYRGQLSNTLIFDQFRFVAEDLLGEQPSIPTSGLVPVRDESDSYWLKFKAHGFNLTGHYFENNYEQISGILAPFTLSNIEYKGELLHISYAWQGAKLSTNMFTDYSHFEERTVATNAFGQNITFFGGGSSGTTIFEPGDPDDAYRWRAGGTFNYQMNEVLSIFAGAEYEKRSASDSIVRVEGMPLAASDFLVSVGFPNLATEPFSVEKFDDVVEKSAYAQIDYQWNRWRFLVGGRYTDNRLWGETSTPRLAAVYTLDDVQSLKFLYSVGFNTPSLDASDVAEIGAAVSNPELDTEEIRTADFAYTYSNGQALFVVNLYYFETEGLIQNVFASSTPADININLNLDVRRWGMEFDYQYAEVDWKLFANLSYHHQGNRGDHSEDIVYSSIADFTEKIGDFTAAVVPRYTGVLGGFYSPEGRHSVGASLRYVGEMKGASAVRLLNLNYSFDIQTKSGITLEFYAQLINALDEDIVHPDDSIPPIELPGGDGRGWIFGSKLHF